jgi:hypothetical protein
MSSTVLLEDEIVDVESSISGMGLNTLALRELIPALCGGGDAQFRSSVISATSKDSASLPPTRTIGIVII